MINKTLRRCLRKSNVSSDIISTSCIDIERGEITGYIFFNGKMTKKDIRKFLAIFPHIKKKVARTAIASRIPLPELTIGKYLEMLLNRQIMPGFNYLDI